MEISRRDFIKTGAASLLGILVISPGFPLSLRNLAGQRTSPLTSANTLAEGKHPWRLVVDITKCIGCGKCLKACKLENDVPPEPECNRTWVERYTITADEQVFVDSPNGGIDGFTADYMNLKYRSLDVLKSFFVPKLCNQCEKPPCVSVCPVGATYATKEGIVLVNRKACIGCRYCIQACPFGARYFDPRYRIVDKCTWCYHRITKGLLPACVEVCPVGARIFGDISDPKSRVAQAIRENAVGILKPELGCENKVYYIGLERGVR